MKKQMLFLAVMSFMSVTAYAERFDCYYFHGYDQLKGSIEINGDRAQLINWGDNEGASAEMAVTSRGRHILIDYSRDGSYSHPIILTKRPFKEEYRYNYVTFESDRLDYCVEVK